MSADPVDDITELLDWQERILRPMQKHLELDFAEPADGHTPETRRTALKLKHEGYNDRQTHPTRPGRKSKGKLKGWQW